MPTKQRSASTLASLENINLSFNKKAILHDVSLELQAGKIMTVIGPNGAGKSTLVRILLGLQKPDTGLAWIKPKLKIGYVPQKISVNDLMPLTVTRFVALAKNASPENINAVLADLGISHLVNQDIQSLSGGEFQRVLLARALLINPELLILDEPAQGVDVLGQAELYEKISQLKNQYGFGVLMISHDLHLVMQKTDQVLCLNQHICCSGQPEDVSNHPEYQRLFGNLPVEGLAVYTHHHNHCHDLDGGVVVGTCKHGDHTTSSESPSPDTSSDKKQGHKHG